MLEDEFKANGIDIRATTLMALDHPMGQLAMCFVPAGEAVVAGKAVGKVFQVIQNYKNGIAAERAVAKELGDLVTGKQIVVRAKDYKKVEMKKDRRIDIQTDIEIIEVKNVKTLELRSQIREFQEVAKIQGKQFVIYTNGKIPPGSKLEKWIIDEGIEIRPIPKH